MYYVGPTVCFSACTRLVNVSLHHAWHINRGVISDRSHTGVPLSSGVPLTVISWHHLSWVITWHDETVPGSRGSPTARTYVITTGSYRCSRFLVPTATAPYQSCASIAPVIYSNQLSIDRVCNSIGRFACPLCMSCCNYILAYPCVNIPSCGERQCVQVHVANFCRFK